MTIVQFLLALGATLRITRFINADFLAGGLRAWVIRRFGNDSKVTYLSTCPWCLSIYTVVPVIAAAALLGNSLWFVLPAAALSISYLVGIAATWLDQ
ncbi:hypothetical protein ACEZCY_14140 [Streptacidiphilus sp. N1-12]|uniref:DUF1360 domain-containing protein n=2 Tax=Streptacidiphilus alkalitolerans TaxID=3342712 RepID=A0ABV6WE92_9ACTN